MLMILEREQDESVHHSRDKQDGTHREPSQRVSRDAQRVESVVVVEMIPMLAWFHRVCCTPRVSCGSDDRYPGIPFLTLGTED